MVGNNPINSFDKLGLEANPFPSNPGPPDPNLDCCDDPTIQEGLDKLNASYEKFKTTDKPDFPEAGKEGSGGETSCHAVNSLLFGFLKTKGIPNCWTCEFKHGHRRINGAVFNKGPDHWWIECKAVGKDGNVKKEVMYDWWRHDTTPGEDPSKNRKRYPWRGYDGTEDGGMPPGLGPNLRPGYVPPVPQP
jgi:hypothetical protein